MVNLLSPSMRVRDIRKLVEPHLFEVSWDLGTNETSEWVMASLESDEHILKLVNWLKSKRVPNPNEAILTNTAWSEVKRITWGALQDKPAEHLNKDHLLIVAADRTWVLEYAPQQIIRFGRWVNVT